MVDIARHLVTYLLYPLWREGQKRAVGLHRARINTDYSY